MRIAMIRLSAASLVSASAEGIFGGAEVRSLTFAQGLADRTEHEVQLVVQGDLDRTLMPCGRLAIHTIPAQRLRCRAINARWGITGLWRRPWEQSRRITRSLFRRATGQPSRWPAVAQLPVDVLCTFGLQDPTAAVVRAARTTGKRSAVFLTSDRDTQLALAPEAVWDRHRRWHRYALERADLVVAQTERQRDLIQRIGRRVVLIRNPIDTRLSAGSITPLVCRKYLLWIGRADTDCKRADLLWSLAQQCPQVPFVAVMNPQGPSLTRQLTVQAPPNVRILPRVDWLRSDVVYRNALALVNTSDSEGFPNAFLQAAKYGVPILSRRVNPDHVLTRFGFGFVAQDDLTRLAAMIHRLWETPQRFMAVSQVARQYVERHHALEPRIEELQRALSQLSADSRTPRAA